MAEKSVKAAFLADVSKDDDDVKELTKAELAKLDRYQRFEKYFPFYRMDINGYQLLLQTARMNTYAGQKNENDEPYLLYEINDISWEQLKAVFKPYKSWAGLNDEDSEFMTFLRQTCLYEDSPDSGPDMRFDSFKLRVLGLLWCEGDPGEKVVEFYDNCQDNN